MDFEAAAPVSVYDTNSDEECGEAYDGTLQQGPPYSKKRRVYKYNKVGAAVYKTRYNQTWQAKWPFITPVKGNAHSFHCTLCNRDVSCSHQGERDVLRHSSSDLHKKNAKAIQGVQKLNFGSNLHVKKLQNQITRAEVKVTNFLVQHNIPLSVTDHLSPLFKDIFHDSEIAKGYSSARTKTTCIVNGSLAPHFISSLVKAMQLQPFTLATDGSNDNGIEKMNPLTVRYFDMERGLVVTQLLDMCLTTGPQAGTAQCIFDKIDEILISYDIPWANCIGVSVDNTSVNLGKNNSIMTRVLQKNKEAYFMGCPCHILHNMALKASESFMKVTKFDVEEVVIDQFYYFDKSTKRKNELAEFFAFCNLEYRQVLKHIGVRWLSLELTISRTLQQYSGLRSYFLSNEGKQDRFVRLVKVYTNPMTEVYLLFYQAVLQIFKSFNKFLQREDPIIPVIWEQMYTFLKHLLGKFVTIATITSVNETTTVPFSIRENQLPDRSLNIGFTTRQLLNRLEHEGEVSSSDVKTFYQAVRSFYTCATEYAVKHLPFKDKVLENSRFVSFEKRTEVDFAQVEFFLKKFPNLLPFISVDELNKLQEEFIDYQMMDSREIPQSIWDSALVKVDDECKHHRMDVIWAHLSCLKNPDGSNRLKRLSSVARIVLILPHSKAEEERVFSMVTKNKTAFRPNLKLDGTLQSILAIKLANPEPCNKYEPPKNVLDTAKKATMNYNKLH